tara:strand:- start:192 stop:1430 length:1239 start_codon:yes stop_codon:yes gene_type:complete
MLLGISSGVLGTFALLRRQSLLGDAMAHAALPGVCVFFLLTHSKHPVGLLLGALVSGLIGSFLIMQITRHSRIKNDTAIGLVLSVFFGGGIVLLTVIQQSGAGNQAGLDNFLFGKAAFLLYEDIMLIGGMACFLLLIVGLFFKEFKVLSFDAGFAESLGFPVKRLDALLTSLIVIAVMIGLQAVGVILMAALLIIPAAAARQWTNRLGVMLVLSAGVGALSGMFGAFFSAIAPKTPTGPIMVLTASAMLLLSLTFAPGRGLLATWLRQRRMKRKILIENILKAFYKEAEEEGDTLSTVSFERVQRHFQLTAGALKGWCRTLSREGFLDESANGYALTQKGHERAEKIVRGHRLWELYLIRQAEIADDHVQRDAEDMEHFLSPEIIAQLEELLEAEPDQDEISDASPEGSLSS